MGLPYLVRRTVVYALSLLGGVIINFVVPRLIPGNPLQAKLMELQRMGIRVAGQDFVDKYMRIFGLNEPLHIQFINYLSSLAQGNLGVSITRFPMEVKELIAIYFPWTIALLCTAQLLCFLIGVPLGALVGWRTNSKASNVVFAFFLVLSQMQYYTVAMTLLYLLAFVLPIFPTGAAYTYGADYNTFQFILDVMWHAALPAMSIILVGVGGWTLAARGLMVGVKNEDYIALAKAKGLKDRQIFLFYALKNTLLPQITDLAITMGFVATGSILVEVIFGYPGMGFLLYRSITSLDYPLIQGISLMYVLGVTTAAFIVELLYPVLDPRVRYE